MEDNVTTKLVALACGAMILSFVDRAHADIITLDYTGVPYASSGVNEDPGLFGDNLTAIVTIDTDNPPVDDEYGFSTTDVIAFSMTSGSVTYAGTPSSLGAFARPPGDFVRFVDGAVISWILQACEPISCTNDSNPGGYLSLNSSDYSLTPPGDYEQTTEVPANGPGNFVAYSVTPGTWTIASDVPDSSIPEPSTLALLSVGLAGLGRVRRRAAWSQLAV
jgi:hypothetical protein